MPIITHICDTVKEYNENSEKRVRQYITEDKILCPKCLKPMRIHSSYAHGVKEVGVDIKIFVVRCKSKCEKGEALLPDFMLPNKQYSAKEIETVVSLGEIKRVSEVDTSASESTVRRWKKQIGDRIAAAISVVKALYVDIGAAVSELALEDGDGFAGLEALLDMAPRRIRHSGSTLGLAILWLGTCLPPMRICTSSSLA
jgi:hypothetical protein